MLMERLVEKTVLQAARVIEEQVDAELERIERLDEDDLDRLREKRLQQVYIIAPDHEGGVVITCVSHSTIDETSGSPEARMAESGTWFISGDIGRE